MPVVIVEVLQSYDFSIFVFEITTMNLISLGLLVDIDFTSKLTCFSLVLFWCLYKGINVSVQYNGGFLPEIILLTLCDYSGEPFQYHEELSLPPVCPPKHFDCPKGLNAFRFFLKQCYPC